MQKDAAWFVSLLTCQLRWQLQYRVIPAHLHVTLSLLLLLEEFLEGAPEASFVLLPTPLAEGGVVILLRPAPPL